MMLASLGFLLACIAAKSEGSSPRLLAEALVNEHFVAKNATAFFFVVEGNDDDGAASGSFSIPMFLANNFSALPEGRPCCLFVILSVASVSSLSQILALESRIEDFPLAHTAVIIRCDRLKLSFDENAAKVNVSTVKKNPHSLTEANKLFYVSSFLKRAPHITLLLALADSHVSGLKKFQAVNHPVLANHKRFTTIDLWNGSSFVLGGLKLFQPVVRDLEGKKFKSATFHLPPFSTVSENGEITGIEVLVFDVIAHAMNFRYTIHTVGGAWNGLVRHLHEKKADFGFAHFFHTLDRGKLIDFTVPFDTDNYCFLVSKPKELPRWMALIMPLSKESWFFLLCTFFSCMVFIVSYAALYPWAEFSVSEGVIFLTGSFFDETMDTTKHLKSTGFKMFFFLYLLPVFVLTTGYRGSFVSILTAPFNPPPMDSVEEVVYDTPLQVGSTGNVIKKDLNKAPEQVYQDFDAKYRLYWQMNISRAQAFKQVEERMLIMYESRAVLEYVKRRDFTNRYGESPLHISRGCSRPFNICFGLPKNSFATAPMGDVIASLRESGIIHKYLEDEMDAAGQGSLSSSAAADEIQPFNVVQVQGAFILWGLMTMASLGVLLLEIGRDATKFKLTQ